MDPGRPYSASKKLYVHPCADEKFETSALTHVTGLTTTRVSLGLLLKPFSSFEQSRVCLNACHACFSVSLPQYPTELNSIMARHRVSSIITSMCLRARTQAHIDFLFLSHQYVIFWIVLTLCDQPALYTFLNLTLSPHDSDPRRFVSCSDYGFASFVCRLHRSGSALRQRFVRRKISRHPASNSNTSLLTVLYSISLYFF